MEESDNKGKPREEVFSIAVRAGKRTYFFDVKLTKTDEYYITITESKRSLDPVSGNFHYEKHKIFLYKEDFEKFNNGLNDVFDFIKTGEIPVKPETTETPSNKFSDVSFEDLKEVSDKEKEEEK